jgi:hypothetical protein
MTTTVRVLRPFLVHHRGQVYGPGETVDVDDRAAAGWAAFGSVAAVEKRSSARGGIDVAASAAGVRGGEKPKPKSSSRKGSGGK